jgi:hypothetical protein
VWASESCWSGSVDLNDPTTVALLAAEAFRSAGLDYALYGGLLTAAYGEPRETRDADLAVVDVTAAQAQSALRPTGLETRVTFEDVMFGGLVVSRVTLIGGSPDVGLNTIDLVRPRSRRYAEAALGRAVTSSLRNQSIRVLSLEDFIIFKVLSTRERDLEDARAARRRSGEALDLAAVDREIGLLAAELPDIDVAGRWRAV